MQTIGLVTLYLVAIVAANLLLATLGPVADIPISFVLIGLDLTCRDKLHEVWNGRRLWLKMFTLIASGSIISYILNSSAGQIAVASFLAFLCAGLVDATVYQLMHRRSWLVKVNGSNIFGAAADSLVFPTVAFGIVLPWIILGQFAAKVAGGLLWSWILAKRKQEPLQTAV